MLVHRLAILALLAHCGSALAQQPASAGMTLAEAAARRHPQPVRVGDLLQRAVLQPIESRPILGRVRQVVRGTDGSLLLVMDYGGVLGFFSRPIAVPMEAVVLLGQEMEIVDFTPVQLQSFATFADTRAMPLPPDSIIRVGLARPSH